MTTRRTYDRGYLYILIAIFCLVIFFIGFRIVNNTSNGDKDIKVTEVFNNVEENEPISNTHIDNNIDVKDIDKNNFFLKILISSNAYMRSIYNIENEFGFFNIKNSFVDNMFGYLEPKTYLKTHLPAILSIIQAKEVSSINYAMEGNSSSGNNENQDINTDDSNATIMEDIIFLEDPVEAEEGENISSTMTKEEGEMEIIKAPSSLLLDDKNPHILVYHTHGTEAYLPFKENNYHTTKRDYNVLTIGEIVKGVLKESGYTIKHIDIYHDHPSYSESYTRSLSTVQNILKEEENVKIVFDIHRDGVEENTDYFEKLKKESKVKINGMDVATYSLVIGPENPNKEALIEFAKYIKRVSDSLYPGLCRGIIVKPYGKFNQFVRDHYALIEVGSNLNTIEEAKNTAKLIGDILDKVVQGITNY